MAMKSSSDTQNSSDYILDLDRFFSSAFRGIKKYWVYLVMIIVLCFGDFAALHYITYEPEYETSVSFTVRTAISEDEYGFSYDASTSLKVTDVFESVIGSTYFQSELLGALGWDELPVEIGLDSLDSSNLFTIIVTGTDANATVEVMNAIIDLYPEIMKDVMGDISLTMLRSSVEEAELADDMRIFKFAILGIAVGVLLDIIFICIYAVYYQTIRKTSELEEALPLHSLAELPYVELKMRKNMTSRQIVVGGKGVDVAFSEAMQSLHTRILRAMPDADKVLLITSTCPGEGKTMLAYNLALMFARKEYRVLLIDGNLRNSTLKSYITKGNADEAFTAEVAESGLPENLITRSGNPNFDLLLRSQQYNENMEEEKFSEIMKLLRSRYSYILIDGPSAEDMSELLPLLAAADQCLYVVFSDGADHKAIEDSLNALKYYRGQILGGVLNGVVGKYGKYGKYSKYGKYGRYGRYGYGRYGRYGKYGYGHYGYGRHEDDTPESEETEKTEGGKHRLLRREAENRESSGRKEEKSGSGKAADDRSGSFRRGEEKSESGKHKDKNTGSRKRRDENSADEKKAGRKRAGEKITDETNKDKRVSGGKYTENGTADGKYADDRTITDAEEYAEKKTAGVKHAEEKTAAGENYVEKRASTGAKYAEERTTVGEKYADEKSSGAEYVEESVFTGKYAEEETTTGTKYADERTAAGTKYAEERAGAGAKYADERTSADAKYAEKRTSADAGYTDVRTSTAAKYADERTADVKYAEEGLFAGENYAGEKFAGMKRADENARSRSRRGEEAGGRSYTAEGIKDRWYALEETETGARTEEKTAERRSQEARAESRRYMTAAVQDDEFTDRPSESINYRAEKSESTDYAPQETEGARYPSDRSTGGSYLAGRTVSSRTAEDILEDIRRKNALAAGSRSAVKKTAGGRNVSGRAVSRNYAAADSTSGNAKQTGFQDSIYEDTKRRNSLFDETEFRDSIYEDSKPGSSRRKEENSGNKKLRDTRFWKDVAEDRKSADEKSGGSRFGKRRSGKVAGTEQDEEEV